MTQRMRAFVLDPDKTDRLPDAVAEGECHGMQTFDQRLLRLYRDGVISMDAAQDALSSPHDVRIVARGVTPAHAAAALRRRLTAAVTPRAGVRCRAD